MYHLHTIMIIFLRCVIRSFDKHVHSQNIEISITQPSNIFRSQSLGPHHTTPGPWQLVVLAPCFCPFCHANNDSAASAGLEFPTNNQVLLGFKLYTPVTDQSPG